MTVLPCPGVRAWPAPNRNAAASDPSSTIGVIADVAIRPPMSSPTTPPGTAPVAGAALGLPAPTPAPAPVGPEPGGGLTPGSADVSSAEVDGAAVSEVASAGSAY